ncbi:DEAD/DEAH box helicase [Bacteroidia bacterium]|nr:DEAD/DEAH box helicase [Bacteroidia bacterium]
MKTFEELGVAPVIIKAISEMGYESPMPVQEEVIPYLLGENNEVIALAQTGTGKTAAFGLPILQKINRKLVQPQAVILCPTRELCLQIADDLKDYSKYMDDLKVTPVYGGSSIESQIKTLRRGVHVIVATPGRLIDLVKRKAANLTAVRDVILDEADEMLNMGFSESLDEILTFIPENHNMLLFSATMPAGIARIAKKYMRDPKEIVIGRKNEGAQNVRHIFYMVNARDKYLVLKRIADYNPNIYGIIFCRTKKETQEIADLLIKDGYNADSLHGDLSQAQRDYVMQKFRLRNIQLLVATDVAARGLDVDDLTHIINYGLPDDIESYTHRSGRTGRVGKTGTSIAIIHLREKHKVKEIEKQINKKFEQGVIPTGKQICERQLFSFVDKIEKVSVNEEEIQGIMPAIYRKLDWLDKEDVIKRLISLEFNRLIDYYREAGEIESPQEGERRRQDDRQNREKRSEWGERGGRGERFSGRGTGRASEKGFSRLFINIGKNDGLRPPALIGLMNDNIPGRKIEVGRIDLMKNFSFFEVRETDSSRVIQQLDGIKAFGRRVAVEVSQPSPSDDRQKKIEETGKKFSKEKNFPKEKKKKRN